MAPLQRPSSDTSKQSKPSIAGTLLTLIHSSTLSNEQKISAMCRYPHAFLNSLYEQHIGRKSGADASLPPVSTANSSNELDGASYHPLIEEEPSIPPDSNASPPIYPAYTGYFQTSADAKRHRKRTRIAPKSDAPDIQRVRQHGRAYWVRRIYEAMIDVSCISDGASSIHRQRFVETAVFDGADLEATAHHVFDAAVAVHVRGWNRPVVYHKKVVRGKLTDVSRRSLERRLARVCLCLRHRKATVDDALRGGVTLALLCDNPEARGFTKLSNNVGNMKRGERLKLSRERTALELEMEGGGEDEQEDEEEMDEDEDGMEDQEVLEVPLSGER